MNVFKIKRALISVYNKTGLIDLVETLAQNDVEILSSGGTAKAIRDAGFKVIEVTGYTGSPEVFSGRVKTLHPKIHGGILMRRDNPDDRADAAANDIKPIDLVVVNLYPFIEKVTSGTPESDAVELIDIGGVALLRAAAKNFRDVIVLHSANQYQEFIRLYNSPDGVSPESRKLWAGQAFAHTSACDSAIENYFTGDITIKGAFLKNLRYGENPHQSSAWYSTAEHGLSKAKQLWGKDMSYLNVLDLDAALNITADFDEPACVIIKHTTPCGLAVGENPAQAYTRAFSCDTRSPFGGIVGFNRTVDLETAQELSKIFLEAIIAPAFEEDALKLLQKKKNLRIIESGDYHPLPGEKKFVSLSGGFLIQDSDNIPISREDFKVVTEIQPDESQWKALVFGAKAVKWAKSNAVVLNNDHQTLGIGCGQTSRVGSVEIAAANAGLFGHSLQGSVMASDAFFPFPDSVEEAAKAGVKAVVQPGGSIRDDLVIEAADKLGIAMVFTGKRHFRH